MSKNSHCNPHCGPFIIYVILAVVSLIATVAKPMENTENKVQVKATTVGVHLVSILIFGGLLYWLCYHCHLTVAWIILLLPVILFVFLLVLGLGLLADVLAISSTQKVTNNDNNNSQ